MATRSTAELDRAKVAKPAARAKRSSRTGPAEPTDAAGATGAAGAAGQLDLTDVTDVAPVADVADVASTTGPVADAASTTGPVAAVELDGPGENEGIPLDAEAPDALGLLGLKKGDPVRWRRKAGGRWQQGSIIGIETDGSMAVSDSQGRWRSLVVDQLEVKGEGPRGASRWEALSDRITQPDQLGLFR